jgi:superfamily II DNA or RNA helicase/diadenosine tetraphosphate (Ap4A) HIT family hydrolase
VPPEAGCVFCTPSAERVFHRDALVLGLWDAFPVSDGHALLVTARHVASWFEATDAEQQALTAAIPLARDAIIQRHGPAHGFNLGVNVGAAAGQTVAHVHLHVIPRRQGDVPDPRGGVRHVIPGRANYRRSPPLTTGGQSDPLSRHVLPLFDRAADIAIVAAFVQESGVVRLTPALRSALAHGARVRIITGDYLDITQASALEQLLDWERAGAEVDDAEQRRGTLQTRVVKMAELPDRTSTFHPKSWRFEAPGFGVAFVGSSNMSRSALDTGIEWNLRVERERDAGAYAQVVSAFDALWLRARPLDEQWLAEYAQRARTAPPSLRGELETEPLEPAPAPHALQVEALERLRSARDEGHRRALVVFATGLGKTWLAAFDSKQLAEELGRPPRVLFVAHRRELLIQASLTYRRLLREAGQTARVSWFVEQHSDLSGQLVFGSVAKLARPENVERLRSERFDYVVIDEVHHAAADSYRRILAAVESRFLLGLTATPDRADAADVLGLFDDFVAHRAGVAEGIALKRLVPFHYFGVKDDIDYAQLPWRNRRFDPAALARAAETEARMQSLWRAWQQHEGKRSLIFCCSVEHARFVRGWLQAKGVRVRAVFAAEGSDDREQALRDLEAGAVDAVCAVDVFNEGVDVPAIDRVVMLRPTESSVVFLQQLGRGLRASDQKSAVTVIDFVGNHRVFLERVRALLSLGDEERAASVRKLLESEAPLELPGGCSVELELEAKELLSRLFNVGGANEVERAYRELRAERGTRPTAGELYRMRYTPATLRERHGSWLGFVKSEGDLSEAQVGAYERAEALLRELEVTPMTKCFKMVTLEVLVEQERLFRGMPLGELARRCHERLERSPELQADVEGERSFGAPASAAWQGYWRRNPVDAWLGGEPPWFLLEGDRFRLGLELPAQDEASLAELVRELVDLRLAQYRARQRAAPSAEGFIAKVVWNQRDPIIRLPGGVARGETDARLPDGAVWQFRFMAQFCNVARPAGTQRNQLPDLLRRWFGPNAGHPGTDFNVRFRATPDGLWVEPLGGEVIALGARRGVIAYPDLRAAAGAVSRDRPTVAEPDRVALPVPADDPELFAVRVSGTSMDGGKEPLRDGDWAVMRVARHAPAGAVEGRVVLVQVEEDHFQIKRLKREGERWTLTSDAPGGPTFVASDDTVAIARLERVIRPEDLAPPTGTVLTVEELGEKFGVEGVVASSGRYGGHLFLFVDKKKLLVESDRLELAFERVRPSETAFVLAKVKRSGWRYLGVGRRGEGETRWQLPSVDYATWKQWGEGRNVSRRLPQGAVARAQKVVEALVEEGTSERWVTGSDGRRARIVGRAKEGGLRIDGGKGGFAERTVSLLDLAWVLAARDDVQLHGGLLDEERVNRLRYLEGTPKSSTRWIDTSWAITCVTAAR